MSVYTRNQPVAADDLDISQPFLVNNTNASDDVFGIDHYAFSNATLNKGFHNKVTTPVFVDSPPTTFPPVTVANPVFYAFQNSANLGVLQYSRGPNNAVPTPVTKLQSPAAGINLVPGGTTNVLDFSGLPGVIAKLYAASFDPATPRILEAFISWNSTALIRIFNSSFSTSLVAQAAGTILQIKNFDATPVNTIVWTLEFMRIS